MISFQRFSLLIAFVLTGFSVVKKASAQQPLFQLTDPKQTGVRFVNSIDDSEKLNVLAYEYFYNGGGVAVGDINNDGLPDLFFTANMKPNKLFLNEGGFRFKDITASAGKALEGRPNAWKTGVTMADVNGDGLLDIYVCYSGRGEDAVRRNQLFINQGNNRFLEKAAEYGLDHPGYSTQAAFFDYDQDGDLDLFLLNHNVKKIDNMEFAQRKNETDALAGNKLFENRNGRFVDVTEQAGIVQNPLTFGLGIAVADIDKDGWPDIYVTNDYNEPDYLYINKHDGTFANETEKRFRHLSEFSMGVDVADINNDGLPDILTLDMLPEDNRRQKLLQLQENYEAFELMQEQKLQNQYMRNMLQLNNGDGTFSEIGQFAGVSNTDWSWSPLIADFDNDGYKDVFITNGYMRDYTNKDFLRYWGDYKLKQAVNRAPYLLMDLIRAMPSTQLNNYIFQNNKDLTFRNRQKEWGLSETAISSGAVYADLDNDGDLDLVINHLNGPASIYRNNASEQKRSAFLQLKLAGKGANTQGLGAKAILYTSAGAQYQEVLPAHGYLSSMTGPLHFGLAKDTRIDSLQVIWPGNEKQTITGIAANQLLSVKYDVAKVKRAFFTPENPTTVFTPENPLISAANIQPQENDFKRQLLMMFMYSKTGPVMAKADVNGDGLEDLFISGDGKTADKIYIQQAGGGFAAVSLSISGNEQQAPVSAAVFFDANGDGKPDLYLASGGYGLYEAGSPALQDRLFINQGKGQFLRTENRLPNLSASSKGCVAAADFDHDGHTDLFVGGRVIPGRYPEAPQSFLLRNNGNGGFDTVKTPFSQVGMVSAAQWVDLNDDKRPDLVLSGECMPLKIFINTPNGFEDQSEAFFTGKNHGLWFSVLAADVNKDGKPDLIAGNLGLNSQIRATEKEPSTLYYADFDGNGSVDPFFSRYVQGTSYPFVSRDELNEQMYSMRKKFTSYKDYSEATINTIFSEADLSKAKQLHVEELQTSLFVNQNGKMVNTTLPPEAQFSVVTKIIAEDYDHDGNTDLLLFGNRTDNRLKLGSIDANYGCLLKGDGKGGFSYVPQNLSGLSVKGDVKSAETITVKGRRYLVIGLANEALQWYRINN
ncbi:MAG: VCBS repeat-containing protein [Mucilaginibacter polytrichastri]|nr:VCBS repeat-containing protein [Mucilaginibacter polytrichastri]